MILLIRSFGAGNVLLQKEEPEWRTRQQRVDPQLKAAGWEPLHLSAVAADRPTGPCAIKEWPTGNGPADYALVAGGRCVGVVEAKKLSLGPQGVLTQAERYSRGATTNPFNLHGFYVPFLYSTNGEIIWFHDVRHRMNRSRRVAGFHSPEALEEMLGRDLDAECERLRETPNDHPKLRPYQIEANAAIEQAIADRKRQMLVAMATGTGKTFTLVNQAYRLMESGVAKRILFLVDRRALAAQAVREFASFEPQPGLKFDKIYEVYSQRFQQGDFEDEAFDPTVLPEAYLKNPKSGHAFVYVCTIQRMAMNLFGSGVVGLRGDVEDDDDADPVDIPIHAFDLVIADECHRGYTAAELSVWRNTLDHFDAIKIGLTATPAAHTTTYFKDVVFRYEYERAVREGYLVDFDLVALKSEVRIRGIFLKEGEQVGMVDTVSGAEQLDLLEDERDFDASEVERRATAPDSNRKILEEISKYANEHQESYNRFPKTLIFAVNDLPHTSHADQLVDTARDVFGRGDAFVQKITGRVDRPLQRIREFRNRNEPGVVVTVDLLTTGIDIRDLEFLVFLRVVKSRILFEQMLGRGTRKGDWFAPDKSHFTVFDCFDGSLFEYFKQASSMTVEPPERESRLIDQVIEEIWQNRDRDYNIRCLVKRLQRVDKEMSGDARARFAAFVDGGNLASFAAQLPTHLEADFIGTMSLLRDQNFQDLFQSYRPQHTFTVAYETKDEVTSQWLIRDGAGREYRPEEYLSAFVRFVRDNPAEIQAFEILLDRPREWGTDALSELRRKLAATREQFTIERLQKAHEAHYHKALVDIISMVKHAARESEPMYTAAERVDRALDRMSARKYFTVEQSQWLARIRDHLIENLSIDAQDFDDVPVFARVGGWRQADRAFEGHLPDLVREMNEAIAA